MFVHPFDKGRTFLGRLEHGEDLLGGIERVAREKNVRAGVFFVIGAVKRATVAFYGQEAKKYGSIVRDEPLEVVSCLGDVSIRDGAIMAHAHVSLSAKDGTTFSGHLMSGTPVFAAEVFVQELLGPDLVRRPDAVTGLTLWQPPEGAR